MEYYKVVFLPWGKEIAVKKSENLLSAAIKAGILINSSCGGDGVCGRCKVIIHQGKVKTEPTGRLTKAERQQGFVLACFSTVESNLEVEVPPQSRLEPEKIPQEEARIFRLKGIYSEAEEIESAQPVKEYLWEHGPLATKLFLELPPPTLEDNISDLERVYREIRKRENIPIMQTGLTNIKKLGHLLRESNWKITVTLGKRNETTEIVTLEPGNTTFANYGIAVDIGTTTVSAQLVNLNTKTTLATKVTYNQQAVFGSDVISRIIFASEEDGLEKLHHAVVDNINSLIQKMVKEHNISLSEVNGVMCAGNTTMIHLLLRVEPTFIRQEPYTPTANFVPVIRAAEVGIKINTRGLLSCVPGVSTYVGGDIVAGVLAVDIDSERELSVLVDIGTNGEIVLGSREWLLCAAASAGPAFEGGGVLHGMSATQGAIQKIKLKGEKVEYATIGNTPPRGICGSGLIDIVAELLRAGLIEKDGKFKKVSHPRLRETQEGVEFVLVFKEETERGEDIVITEGDIENIKRAKAAIYAALSLLLKKNALSWRDVKQFYIAGGFGNYLNIENAITLGLLPDVERTRFKFVGNSSLIGCREILLSYQAMREAEKLASEMVYFELSNEPQYISEYLASLFFPHTDLDAFPSVIKVRK